MLATRGGPRLPFILLRFVLVAACAIIILSWLCGCVSEPRGSLSVNGELTLQIADVSWLPKITVRGSVLIDGGDLHVATGTASHDPSPRGLL